MQFLILFTLNPDKAETLIPPELRDAEFEEVRRLYMEGSLRQIWLRDDVRGACAIVEATSHEGAAESVSALPLVRAGVLRAPTIVPLKPYVGFGPRS
jgi:muconolactone delta-isomerase